MERGGDGGRLGRGGERGREGEKDKARELCARVFACVRACLRASLPRAASSEHASTSAEKETPVRGYQRNMRWHA